MDIINKYWSTFGGILGISILAYLAQTEIQFYSINALAWLNFAFLLFHQFEEYTFPGGFQKFYNLNIYNKNRITRFPLNYKGILLVNVILAWPFYFIGAIYGEKWTFMTLGLSAITLLNGIMHIIMYINLKKYNPGLFTSLFLFLPLGSFVLAGKYDSTDWAMGMLIFIVGTAFIPLSIRISNK